MDANPSVSTNGMEDEYDDEPEGEDDPYLIEGDEDGEGAARPVSNAGSSKAKANVTQHPSVLLRGDAKTFPRVHLQEGWPSK